MEIALTEKLESMRMSFAYFVPELILTTGILLLIVTGLFKTKSQLHIHGIAILVFTLPVIVLGTQWTLYETPVVLFGSMLRSDDFSAHFKILFSVSGILTVLMTWRRLNYIAFETKDYIEVTGVANGDAKKLKQHLTEYYALLAAIVLGAHLLVMSKNFVMAFLALELISISSYVLTGFAFDKKSAEGSLKYFLFGSVISAVMLYGFSLLYGLTGTLDFLSHQFVNALIHHPSPLFFIAGFMSLAGFLFKIAAAPFHPWAPDVYEAAPMPIVAFFSVVPKLAGVGILTKFILTLNLFGQSGYDWRSLLCIITIITLTVGNFSALWQKNPKRLMAYSSIAQSGFLLVGLVAFMPSGIHFMLFYANVYLIMNFLVFIYLQYFELKGFQTIESFAGMGKVFLWPSIFILIGFISLTGLPPTGGFTAKLFVFSSTWDAFQLTNKQVLLWLMIFGLLNTVVSLFYYLRIPYYAFISKSRNAEEGNSEQIPNQKGIHGRQKGVSASNFFTFENLLGVILVLVVLGLFFSPGLLMGWINKITFVL